MSMNFEDDMNEETRELLKETFGDSIKAMDSRNVLLESMEGELKKMFSQEEMKKVANTAKQPVSVELNGLGDIKTMSDGTEYALTKQGWRKLTHRAGQR